MSDRPSNRPKSVAAGGTRPAMTGRMGGRRHAGRAVQGLQQLRPSPGAPHAPRLVRRSSRCWSWRSSASPCSSSGRRSWATPRTSSSPASRARRASTSTSCTGCCSASLVLYVAGASLAYLQDWMLAGVVQRTMFRLRSDVEDKLNRLPLRYVDRQPRGDLLSRVTNDIDNLAQSLQQTLSQLLTSTLTLVGVADHDDHDLAAAGAGRARSPSPCRSSRSASSRTGRRSGSSPSGATPAR